MFTFHVIDNIALDIAARKLNLIQYVCFLGFNQDKFGILNFECKCSSRR